MEPLDSSLTAARKLPHLLMGMVRHGQPWPPH
jgi:hypothetical protein